MNQRCHEAEEKRNKMFKKKKTIERADFNDIDIDKTQKELQEKEEETEELRRRLLKEQEQKPKTDEPVKEGLQIEEILDVLEGKLARSLNIIQFLSTKLQ